MPTELLSALQKAGCLRVAHRGRSLSAAITALVMLTYAVPLAPAADTPRIKITRSVTISEVGDGQVKLEVNMPAETYTTAKTNNPNTAILLRRLGAGTNWAKLANLHGRFDDNTSTVVIEYSQLGAARITSEDLWEFALESDIKVELLGAFDNTAVFNATTQTDLGAATLNLRVEAPKAAKEIKLQHDPDRVTYRFTPTVATGTSPGTSFSVDVKSKIMSSLAKSYAETRLADLWVIRTALKNTGDQTLNDYRVHCRVPGFSEYSEWKRCRRVQPGQTVVDAFFPVFETEKLSKLTSPRRTMVEVEYEYRQQDGRTVHESETRQVQILGLNEVVYSSYSEDEAVGFYDKHNYGPVIITSFIANDDSLMQDLATRITTMGGGASPSQNDENAKKFLTNLYTFLNNNKIALQPWSTSTVKYGRDALRTRSATCVDLAILFASACEAAGLKPVVYLMSGDCVPAVRLPGGQIQAVQITKADTLTYANACDEGEKLVKEARTKGLLYEIDVAKWRGLGVRSLDLAPFESGFLERNFKFGAGELVTTPPTTTTTPATTGKVDNSKLVGRWVLQQTPEGRTVAYTMIIAADGKYSYRAVVTTGNQVTSESQEAGTVQQEETTLKFTPTDAKQPNIYLYRLRGDELDLQLQGTANLVTFRRAT